MEDDLPPRAPVPEGSAFRAATNPTEPDRPKKVKPRSERPPVEVSGGASSITERILFGKVSSQHLTIFCRQFASYTDAGVDLLRSLEGLRKQFAKAALGQVIARIQKAVKAGETLSDAMGREPQAFDKLFLSMMRVAETRGGVPEMLKLMADHYEARVRLVRQARSALIYPVIVMTVGLAVMMLLAIFVLPKFADLLKDLGGRKGGGELPFASRALMGIADFMSTQGWWLVHTVTIGSVFWLFQMYRTRVGKSAMDEIALYIPVFGGLLRKIDTARFARTLAVLTESGVDIDLSLKLTAEVMRLAPYKKAVSHTRDLIKDGMDLHEAMADTNRFGQDVLAIVSSGEESGRLPQSLEKLADDYEEQVEYTVKNLGELVQPIIMIFMGLMVLFVILAVILPYISMITSLSG